MKALAGRMTRLGDVLRLDLTRVLVDAATSYPMVGVLSFGRGLFEREAIVNGGTSYRHFYQLKAEHVVMSQLFGWEGALALSSEAFAGRFLSPQFPTFLCEETQLDRAYLGWLLRRRAFWEDLGSRASGMGDRRRTLTPEALFACEVPLPPLPEQRRIVAQIEEQATLISEARTLRVQAVEEAERLLVGMAHRLDLDDSAKRDASWRRMLLVDCLRLVDDSARVVADQSYPNLGIYSFGRGLFRKSPIDGAATSAKTLRRVRAGQFIYSRLFAFEGAYGLVDNAFDGHYVSNEYPTFDCDPSLLRVEFLSAYFKAPPAWRAVAIGSKGLGHRRQRVQPDQLLGHAMWIPPLSWQEQLVKVWHKVVELRRVQDETIAELDALLPAILDRAFKGEL